MQLLVWVVVQFISYLLQPKPKVPDPGKIDIPTVEEGRKIGIRFGAGWIKGPHIFWWGDVATEAIKGEKPLFGKAPILGYRYSLGMHQIFGLSPVTAQMTAIGKIKVGEKDVWSSGLVWAGETQVLVAPITTNTQIGISLPDLFGGDDKEGGIVGAVDIEFGGAGQGVNSYLAKKLTGMPVPAFRGLFGLVLRQVQVSAMSPYIKPWSIYASRINGGFYPAKAKISEVTDPATLFQVDAMNPAHIIYEVLTSYDFGIGLAPVDIDIPSFTTAADVLYTEKFGLSFFWNGEQIAEDFISYVLEHIDGVVYSNPSTGKLTIKLARDDYAVTLLPIFDPSNIISVNRLSQPLPGELVSEVQVKFEDQITGAAGSVNVHDIAVMEIQGGHSIPTTFDYQGIPNAVLAARVALRELRVLATPLVRAEIVANRQAWSLNVGEVFRLQWPPLGIAEMVMRVAALDYGTLTDGVIVVEAVQDVFRAATTAIGVPSASGWTPPWNPPAASPLRLAIEAPYWVVARDAYSDNDTLLAAVDPASGLLLATGNRPSSDAYSCELWSSTGTAAYINRTSSAFSPTALLDAPVGRTETEFAIRGGVDIGFVDAATWAHIGGELVKVVSYTATTLTVKRGVLDTVPAPHPVDAVIHFADGAYGLDKTEWSSGQTVNVKLLPRTGLGTLLLAAAPVDSVVMAQRFIRPYPPGNVLVNAVSYPASVIGDLAITWAHRDRTLQTAYIVEQTEASIGPEVGTTYTVRIYNAQTAGTLIRTYAGLTGTSQAYTAAQATTDNGGVKPPNIRIEIESVRAGYVSWQKHTIPAAWV